jgi:hypothetical protein
MGLFRDHAFCDFEGKHNIELEARSTLCACEYSLIIDNKRVDQISGFMGTFKLRGFLEIDGMEQLVIVKVKQGLFGTKFSLEIDGKQVPLIKDV